MSTIRKIKQQGFVPTTSRASMIANIKMEISRINNMANNGNISQEDAQRQLAVLEAKLSALESGQSIDGEQFEIPASIETESIETESPDENSQDNNNFEENQCSFFEQQSVYNRIFHNI